MDQGEHPRACISSRQKVLLEWNETHMLGPTVVRSICITIEICSGIMPGYNEYSLVFPHDLC